MQLNRRAGHVNMHGIVLDYSAWPRLQVTPPPYSLSDDALLEFMSFHRQLVRSMDSRYVLILDLRNCDHMSRNQHKKITDVISSAKDNPLPACAGTVLVFSSPMLRHMLTALFWLFKPPYPVKVVPDLASAQSWSDTLLPDALRKAA